MNGKHETARALLELKVDKDAKDEVRNRMMMMMMMTMMMMMMMIIISVKYFISQLNKRTDIYVI